MNSELEIAEALCLLANDGVNVSSIEMEISKLKLTNSPLYLLLKDVTKNCEFKKEAA